MRKCAVLAVFMMIGGGSAAIAQSHSAEDEAACTPDVKRLCREFIPDRDAIIACMIEKKRELKPACAKVFARPQPRNDERAKQPAAQRSSAAD